MTVEQMRKEPGMMRSWRRLKIKDPETYQKELNKTQEDTL
jgi:hypothetical protein